MEQRLADRPAQRWLWAAGCALPVLGVPLLLWHGRERRTALPFLYGLTCQAIAAFALASLAGACARQRAWVAAAAPLRQREGIP